MLPRNFASCFLGMQHTILINARLAILKCLQLLSTIKEGLCQSGPLCNTNFFEYLIAGRPFINMVYFQRLNFCPITVTFSLSTHKW